MTKTKTHPKLALEQLEKTICRCTLCPRLVDWREQVAREKVKRFNNFEYWGKAVPSFGVLDAQLLIVGLAPAAHGANRTGRMFTGDRSGDWLYKALHKAGFANQPHSVDANDGLKLNNVLITAVAHCAPPANKPTRDEITNCRPYLVTELTQMKNLQVILCLGKIAHDAVIQIIGREIPGTSKNILSPKPVFSHGSEFTLPDGKTLMGSYHPSQQNTFTKRLTEPMFDSVFTRINEILDSNN